MYIKPRVPSVNTTFVQNFPIIIPSHVSSRILKTMPHKKISTDPALEASVAILREGIGPTIAKAFVIAPLWAPGIGCIGLITLADIPYAQPRKARRQQGGRDNRRRKAKSSALSRCPYVAGVGVVEFARRVGLALGGAIYRIQKGALIAGIGVESELSEHDRDSSNVALRLSLAPQEQDTG